MVGLRSDADDQRDEKQTARVRDDAVRRALNTPPTPHTKPGAAVKKKRGPSKPSPRRSAQSVNDRGNSK
jgi:hypothetical protein